MRKHDFTPLPDMESLCQNNSVSLHSEVACDVASVMCPEATMSEDNRPARGDKTITNNKGETTMKMQEMYFANSQYQVVLSFSNNEWVLLSAPCFEPNSEFIRRSKVRLEQDFYLVESTNERDTYRTYRGPKKCDYIAYVNKGEWMELKKYRETVSRGKTLHKSADRQKSVKNDTPPNKRPVIYATPKDCGWDEIRVRFHYNSERLYEERIFKMREPKTWYRHYNYYAAVLRTMSRLIDTPSLREDINELVIYNTNVSAGQARITWSVLSGKYKGKTYWTRKFHEMFVEYKAKLQDLGITVTYVLEG